MAGSKQDYVILHTSGSLSDMFTLKGVYVHIDSHVSEVICTCQLFLYLCRICVSEQSYSLCDATAATDLLLVFVAFKGEVTQGGRGCLVDLDTRAAEQTHQGRDPIQLEHLRDKRALVVSIAKEHKN